MRHKGAGESEDEVVEKDENFCDGKLRVGPHHLLPTAIYSNSLPPNTVVSLR